MTSLLLQRLIFPLHVFTWLSSWCWICPIFGVFVWFFRARKGRGFSKGKKLVSLPVYQWSTWHLALILYLCLEQLWLGFPQCWTSRLSGMLFKRCEWGVTSQQCSVQIPFLACVACAEFTGICIIGCFHRGDLIMLLLVLSLMNSACRPVSGWWDFITAPVYLGSMKTQAYGPCTS